MGKNTCGSASAADDGGGSGNSKREQPLQAVLLADDFHPTSFCPLNLEKPKMLTNVNNVPMIEYALDFLGGAGGVQELFVVCVSDAVEEYFNKRQQKQQQRRKNCLPYNSISSSMQITVIKDSFLTNAGDALREVDKRNVIQSDPFILMWGDTVTNIRPETIQTAIARHQARKRKDSSAIMTLFFKKNRIKSGGGVRASSGSGANDDLFVGMDPTQDNRLLVYDNHSDNTKVSIPCVFLAANHPYMDLRNDLTDVHIDLCSPEVLARIADEFDYRDLRKEFVANSVAEEEEGLQNKLFGYILSQGEYAARVVDFATYQSISQDILKRWCYPVVPEYMMAYASTGGKYKLLRHYLYQECSNVNNTTRRYVNRIASPEVDENNNNNDGSPTKSATVVTRPSRIGRSSRVDGAGMIGRGCDIGERVSIQSSVLEENVTIEDRAKIVRSFLWSGAVIERGATVIDSIVSSNAIVKQGAVVERGCIIGAGCIVGSKCVIPEFTRVTMAEEKDGDEFGDDDDWDDSSSGSDGDSKEEDSDPAKGGAKNKTPAGQGVGATTIVTDVAVVGADGNGRVWKPSVETNEEDLDNDEDNGGENNMTRMIELLKSQSMGYDPTEYLKRRLLRQQDDDIDDFSGYDDKAEGEGDLDSIGDGADGAMGVSAFDDDDEDDGAVTFTTDNLLTAGVTNLSSSGVGGEPVIVGRQKGIDVIKELKTICLEYESPSPIENLAIELNSFKFSQNATYSDCTMAATLAILDKMEITKGISDGKLVAEFKSYLDHWAPLLRKMSIGMEEEKAIVLALEQCALDDDKDIGKVLGTGASFRFLLQTLHDEEIVSEDAILSWAADRKTAAQSLENIGAGDADSSVVIVDKAKMEKALKLFQLKTVQDFLEWLAEDSESGGDDDVDDDDDDGSE